MATQTNTGMSPGDWISAVQHIVEAFAVLIGGLWAYWKFVRGRTFHHRAELEVEPSLIVDVVPRAVRVNATMKNTGAADIPLRAAVVRLAAYTDSGAWKAVESVGVFADHEWVESQETISDEVLIPLNAPLETYALRLTCLVIGTKRKFVWRKTDAGWTRDSVSTGWTRNVILPASLSLAIPQSSMKGELPMTNSDETRQRQVGEEEAQKVVQESERVEKQRGVSEEEARKVEEEAKKK